MSPALRALRDAGVSVEQLAQLLGLRPVTVSKYLRGTLDPGPKLAVALEELLGDAELARQVLKLIPERQRVRAASSPALRGLHSAGGRTDVLAAAMAAL